ncbi:MAG: hypothetical protein MZU95_02385 [Desulfomicrobium escambiense]|nr:hypothetical protein [Desulfomicrobium escambiense]
MGAPAAARCCCSTPRPRPSAAWSDIGLSERYRSKGPVFAGVSLGEVEERSAGRSCPTRPTTLASSTRRRPQPRASRPSSGCRCASAAEMAGALRLYYPFEFAAGCRLHRVDGAPRPPGRHGPGEGADADQAQGEEPTGTRRY